jgi:hypothetical protein
MIQLVDQHLRLGLLLFMLAEIDERSKVLNNITILILNRADEEGGPELAAATVKNFRATLRAPTLNAGDASLNSGSGGGYTLLTNGRIYGLALASGEFGSASVDDAILNSHSGFDTTGFASSVIGGVVLPAGPATKLDFRAGLNYLAARADNHTDSAQIHFRDGKVDESSGTLSVRLFSTWIRGQTVMRPFVQGGVDYRFHYENEMRLRTSNSRLTKGAPLCLAALEWTSTLAPRAGIRSVSRRSS